MGELTCAEAARQAIAEEMRRDPGVWALGEDLGRGGVFGQYAGLVDALVPLDQVREAACELAREIAASAPLAVVATRATVRGDLAERVARATDRELAEQTRLRGTKDWAGRVKAMAERRRPSFVGA